ncbi:MAG: patatin-like phospholipase family protein [Saprospiraceae bacterium]|nr:patatin-like phospholipase family protein [Saprospiraceae bacterium]
MSHHPSQVIHDIGITLSGGGAKGIAHIGVLRALLECNVHPTVISGTSAGSIIGVLYAAGMNPDDMEKFVSDSSFIKIFRVVGLPGAGFVRLDYLKERLSEFIKTDSFEALKYELYICATNLNYGRPVHFSEGTLFDKIMASCSVPWLFKPIEIAGNMYADGGITNNLPAQVIRPKCRVLIGSNVKPKVVVQSNADLDSFIGITQRCADLSLWTNSKPNVKALDVYIAPEKIHDFSFFNVRKTPELAMVGYEETMRLMPKIKELIATKAESDLFLA